MLKFKGNRYKRKGFTLIELLVVLAIIGLLSVIAIPRYLNILDGARIKADGSNVNVIRNAAEIYYLEKGSWPAPGVLDEDYAGGLLEYLQGVPRDPWNREGVYYTLLEDGAVSPLKPE